MSAIDSDSNTPVTIIEVPDFDEAQVAAAAFLARYNGSTPIGTTCERSSSGPPTRG